MRANIWDGVRMSRGSERDSLSTQSYYKTSCFHFFISLSDPLSKVLSNVIPIS